MQASDYAASNDCCRSSCYECGCEPLYECAWGLQFDAGVRPIIWTQRDHYSLFNCFLGNTEINDLGKLPKFSHLYRLPWQVGGQVSYALSTNTNVFVEFNYAQAQSKHQEDSSSALLLFDLNKYKLYEGYVGARYYWDRWCDRVSFFLGIKVGFLHHKSIQTEPLAVSDCNCDLVAYDFFRNSTVFAGGGHVGLDICFCGNWSFVITGEVVASCGPKGVNDITVCALQEDTLCGAAEFVIPGISTELAFPVTLGIKYNF